MSRKFKILISFLLISAFLYGLAVGHFRIFPFQQIIDLRNKIYSTIVDVRSDHKEEFELITEPTIVLETALQRLLIKKVHLQQGLDIARGGAMTNLGYIIFMNTNSNNIDRDKLIIYDLENHFQYDTDELKVPMNYEKLLSSQLVELKGFDLFRFRITGLYAEENENGTHTLFVSHNFFEEDENCISFNLSRTTLHFDDRTISQTADWETIFKAEPCIYPENNLSYRNPFPGQMAGGKIVNYDNDRLLVSVGSFSTDPGLYPSLPMDSTSSFGKFLLIDKLNGEGTIYAKGSRNSQGLFIDLYGTIWSTDHGPQGGDELNIIQRGKNFGWPQESYGIQYGNEPWALSNNQGRHDSYDKPAFVWMPAIAPTNIIRIHGDKFPLWKEDLIIGSLTGRSLHRLRIEENHRVIYNEAIHLGYRIRDLLVLPNDKIVLLTDEGSLFIIDDGGPIYEEPEHMIQTRKENLELYDRLLDESYRQGIRLGSLNAENIYDQHCSSCHFLEEMNDIGPHLNNLFGRRVGALSDFNYSNVFDDSDEIWTPDLLRSFLLDPDDIFPNSRMLQIPLTEAETDSIISFLRK